MSSVLKLATIGTSVGIVTPKSLLQHMNVGRGDKLFAVEGPNNTVILSPYDPVVEEQLKAGEDLMKEYRDVFKALAK